MDLYINMLLPGPVGIRTNKNTNNVVNCDATLGLEGLKSLSPLPYLSDPAGR